MKSKKGFALSVLLVFFICGVTIPLFMTNHTKVKADTVTDLTGTTWIFNDIILPGSRAGYFNNINYTSNNVNYTAFNITNYTDNYKIYFNTNILVYEYNSANKWVNNSYKTITITGGTNATNTNLINLLQSIATQYTPPPPGTQISHRYWSPYGVITMEDNERIGDESIEYTVLFNEYTDSYDETVQTGLIFLGVQIDDPNVQWSYIESINGTGINILYHGTTNNINNAMWLEFTPGDYIDTELYDLMDLYGHWFDDDDAYIVGMNQGYVEGLQNGRALGQADGVEYTGLITNIFNGLGNILSIQVFPNITIGLLIGLPLLLGAFIIIIKILRG